MDLTGRIVPVVFLVVIPAVFVALLIFAIARAAAAGDAAETEAARQRLDVDCPTCGEPLRLDAAGVRATCPCLRSDVPSGLLDDPLELAFALPARGGRLR